MLMSSGNWVGSVMGARLRADSYYPTFSPTYKDSIFPGNDVFREPNQRSDSLAQGCQSVHRLILEFRGLLLGALQAQYAGVGGLVAGRVGAGSFAQGIGVAFHVQDVVLDLEGQAHALGIAIQRRELCSV